MGFKVISTTAAGRKFFDNRNLLKRIARFEAEVKADPRTFQAGILARFERETVAYGQQQLTNMHRILGIRDFPSASVPREIAPLLDANLDRYKGLWQQNVRNAFATAASSIPGATRLGTRTLLQRLFAFLGAREQEQPGSVYIPKKIRDKAELQGIVRTALIKGRRRIFRQSLSKFLKMLFRTYPMNFLRDHNLIVVRAAKPEGTGEEVFLVSTGRSSNSSPVCVRVQGRALTRSALTMVTRDLQSPLFHPNCRHRILTTPGGRESTYDGKQGPLVTVKTVAAWLGSGKIKRARRPSPRVVNI